MTSEIEYPRNGTREREKESLVTPVSQIIAIAECISVAQSIEMFG